jgi:hypothetical protein
MSSTAPNLLAWPRALAAWPSTASSRQLIVYSTVQNFGCIGMKKREIAARMTRE